MNKRLIAFIILIITILGNSCFIIADLKKNESKTIKIPDYNMSRFIYTDEIGNRAGYSYEIFQEIAKYTDWNYEYVKCDRSQCIEMLQKGELDIVDSCVLVEERKDKVSYSDLYTGFATQAIVSKSDSQYITNDFKNYNGIKIGIVDEGFWNDAINKISAEKDFKPQVVKFKTYEEKFQALENNEIDAVLTMSLQNKTGYKILCEVNSIAYYLTVNKENTELLNELNYAMEQIWLNDSTYFSKVYNKYYEMKNQKGFFLTDEEKEYIKQNPVVRAAGTKDRAPMSYYEDGEYKGIVSEIIKKACEKAGLKVEFKECDSYKEIFKDIRNDELDIVCNFLYDYSWAEKNGVVMTFPYIDPLNYIVIKNKKLEPKLNNEYKIAYVEDYFFNEKYLFPKYGKDNLVLCKDETECAKMVNDGKADMTYISNYIAEKIVRNNEFYNITTAVYPEFQVGICAAAGKNNDVRLVSILNKAIENIDNTEINQIISNHTINHKEKIGLLDFIKRNLWVFISVIIIGVLIIINITLYILNTKKRYDETIYNLAYVDPITGCWNINKFESEAEKKLENNDFTRQKFAVVSFDISKFRIINEHYGRFVGDRVLKYIEENIKNTMIYGMLYARASMDNFVIMIPYSNDDEYTKVLKSISEKSRYYEEGGVVLRLNFQCGIYLVTGNNISINKAIDMAEIARKEARSVRKDKIIFFDKKMEDKIIRYKEIEERMEIALEEREFVVYYQPKVNIESENIIGAEALVRWISKEKGFMNPGEFIPIFEKEGFIIELDFYVLEEVFKLIKEWLDTGKNPITISVNQSRVHLSNPYYIERLKNLIKKYKVPTKYIELELTENLFSEIEVALETVNKIKDLGFSVSVDDFGSGYSSLNMLKSIPFDVVKIDREFLNESENSEKAQKIICKIVEMAKDLDMNVICEGVEKEEQADFLKSIGCYYAQGFLYAKPMPEPEFRDKVKGVIED